MWSHPSFLSICEELSRSVPELALEPGMKIARGFADLGYEEFLLLPGDKLLALYSGQVTQLQESHRHFFFPVPSPDEMIARINKANWDIAGLTFDEQRTWKVQLIHAETKASVASEAGTLEESLAYGLLAILKG